MFSNIKGNIFGGITAAVIALPLALAFGVASGVGAISGIYGAIVIGFLASLFGGTSTQISGPTGPMTVVIASAVVLFHGDIKAVMSVIFLAGIFQIVFGIAKVGKYVKYIPYPVISGFMSGIGMIIIILQINPFLGLDGFGSVMQTLLNLPSTLTHVNFNSIIVAFGTLIIMFFTPQKVSKIIPTSLMALVFMTVIAIIFNLDIKTIGEIPSSLPEFTFPSFEMNQVKNIIGMAFTLALLGTIDTLLTSLVADSMTKTKHDSNRELIGQGIGNTFVSMIGGIAGAGATMRTVVNIKSGGTTKLSGMIHAATLLVIILFFAPIASQIPLAVLAGILMKVGVDILDYKLLKMMNLVPKHDLVVMIVVFVLTVFVDLIMAVGVGVVLASMLIVYRITVESEVKIDFHKDVDDVINKDIRIVNIDGAFFFGSASMFEDKISEIIDTKKIVINCLDVPFIDISAIFVLEEMVLKLKDLEIEVVLVLRDRHMAKLKRLDKIKVFDEIPMYRYLREAIE
ncbi:SulP family inorganic anion transporter [Sulfurimonas sp.]|uniref:SulP family inorganic anion transporter n=1 Tax=Sulfurimonas sp. TaxID=2022749 RepID=UPI002AB28A54|nr:SulP family inorganic anion transporter [Sulfurimonas sp.]